MPGQITTRTFEAPASAIGATSTIASSPVRRRAAAPSVAQTSDEPRRYRVGETLLLIGAVAIGGPVVLALAGTLVILALALAGPFLLTPILALSVFLVAIVMIGAAG